MRKKNRQITLDDLAAMIASGFDHTATKEDLLKLEGEVGILQTDVGSLKMGVENLQTDVSDIKIRLDYLAPKFQVDNLEKRVKRLEEKPKFAL